jgi:hypothetical protein
MMRDCLERHYQRDLAAALDGPDAVGRAALLISMCAGVQLQRDTALTNRAASRLAPYLEAALRAIAVPVDSPNAGGSSV